ncbi:MAG TPA: hypothetical protein VH917_00060 [Ignavibacteriaceae bacterium]|jgi:hypothetical protein
MMLQNVIALSTKSKTLGYIFVDLIFVAFIYFVPALSHLTTFPLYLLEPMRFVLISSIIYTNRTNSVVIAVTLPLISFFISVHPELLKGLLISTELLINVVLFYYLIQRLENKFLVMLISIIFSKGIYYTAKFYFLTFGFLQGDLISTPLWIQYLMIFVFSLYIVFAGKDKQYNSAG